MNKEFKEERIAISNLTLWDENARFPDKYFNSDETKLVEYFLTHKEFKIDSLLEEIVKDADLPQLEKLVVWNNNGDNIVLEGNRRLTCYKLLANPSFIKEPKKISDRINVLSKKINIDNNFRIECLVTNNKEQGLRYIDRKHAKSNNEVNWQDTERAHYNIRRGRSNSSELLKIGISKVVRNLDLPDEITDAVLGKNYVTTFFRIVTTGPSKKKYGLKIDDNGNLIVKNEDFYKELKVIIYNVLNKKDFKGNKVDSRSLNKNPEIHNYLESLSTDDVGKVEREIKRKTTKDFFGNKKIKISDNKKTILPKSTTRSYLIPKKCKLHISEKKINNIYLELRNDLLLDETSRSVPNAVSVLFRVFLEITLDYFLEKHGLELGKDATINSKINKTCDLLLEKEIVTEKQLKNIRKVSSSSTSLLGIQNFHDYVHSYKANPSSIDLKQKWDNLEEFFQLIWDHLYKKES